MGQQVVGAAIDGLRGHDVLAGAGKGLEGVADGRRAAGHRQGRAATLQRGDALFKDVVGGVGQPPVDVAGIPQAEAVGGVLAVVKHEGRRRVDRHGAGVGDGIGMLLADVQLAGFKGPVFRRTDIRHFYSLLSVSVMVDVPRGHRHIRSVFIRAASSTFRRCRVITLTPLLASLIKAYRRRQVLSNTLFIL